jgi:hypothetical protein
MVDILIFIRDITTSTILGNLIILLDKFKIVLNLNMMIMIMELN